MNSRMIHVNHIAEARCWSAVRVRPIRRRRGLHEVWDGSAVAVSGSRVCVTRAATFLPMTDTALPSVQEDLAPRWLLLLHQLPIEPAYIRVKVRRRLARLGAVPVKNSVYALPS
jgi:hypothetical protein